MNSDDLQNDWALVAGATLALLVFLFVGLKIYQKSAPGQLRRARRVLKLAEQEHRKVQSKSVRCQKRVQKLAAKSKTTRPRILQEAKESLEDARALEKILGDKVLVARNHVRKIIVNEYSPGKHERMRRKYLPAEKTDQGPFTF